MTVSQALIQWLKRIGIRHVFLVPGSQVDELTKALVDSDGIESVVACTELGAGFMADGYARINQKPAACISIGGPGASMLLPSAIISRIDKSPVVYILGSSPKELPSEYVFQSTSVGGSRDSQVYAAAIDHAIQISPNSLHNDLLAASSILSANRPIQLSISVDDQIHETTLDFQLPEFPKKEDGISSDHVSKLKDALFRAKSPVLLIGADLRKSAGNQIRSFLESTGILFATTLQAKGIVPETLENSLGCFGYAGSDRAMEVFLGDECDLILALGISFSQREMHQWNPKLFSKKWIAVTEGTDPPDFIECETIHTSNYSQLLEELSQKVQSLSFKHLRGDNEVIEEDDLLTTSWLMAHTRRALPDTARLFVDAGYHRFHAARQWTVYKSGTFFSSEKQAPMGWAIPAAIGGQLADSTSRCIVLTGDGCFQMQGLELITAMRYELPIIFILINNQSLGSIASRLSEDHREKLTELMGVNWVSFARSLGADGAVADTQETFELAMKQALASVGPFLIEAQVSLENSKPDSKYHPKSVWPELT